MLAASVRDWHEIDPLSKSANNRADEEIKLRDSHSSQSHEVERKLWKMMEIEMVNTTVYLLDRVVSTNNTEKTLSES